jgi:hypothetical protein
MVREGVGLHAECVRLTACCGLGGGEEVEEETSVGSEDNEREHGTGSAMATDVDDDGT